MNALQHRFCMPLIKEQVQMYIKYCEPCQCNNTRHIKKCPQQMVPIKVEWKVWSQIGINLCLHLFKLKSTETI